VSVSLTGVAAGPVSLFVRHQKDAMSDAIIVALITAVGGVVAVLVAAAVNRTAKGSAGQPPAPTPRRFVGLRAEDGTFVCADADHGGRLVAGRLHLKAWETFEWVERDGKVHLVAHNGRYVAAELESDGALVADRAVASAWETFTPIRFPDGRVALLAGNGRYVSAGEQGVRATAESVSVCERFTVVELGTA
jgi:hypothetical protein